MGTRTLPNNMKVALVLAVVASAYAAPDTRFTCSECVSEMHKLGGLVKMGAVPIHDYIVSNYCPTLEHNHDQDFCVDSLSKYYVGMLFAIVNHYFVDGAVHVCQTGGACEAAKEYTCQECVQGLEWVEAYLEDPIMIAEMTLYLRQNFCIDEWENCRDNVAVHFRPMHEMTMEKFLSPLKFATQSLCALEKLSLLTQLIPILVHPCNI